jgi:hypothetical protein
VQLLDALPADVSSINRLSAVLAANKADFEALHGMGRELRALSFDRTSSVYYERALRGREGRRPGVARTELLVGLERNALDLRLFADAARLCETALRQLAGRPEEAEVRVDLGRALLGLGKTEEAARVLLTVISRHKDTPAAAEAARLLGGGDTGGSARQRGHTPASGPSIGRTSYGRPARWHQYSQARSNVNVLRVRITAAISPSLRNVISPSADALS